MTATEHREQYGGYKKKKVTKAFKREAVERCVGGGSCWHDCTCGSHPSTLLLLLVVEPALPFDCCALSMRPFEVSANSYSLHHKCIALILAHTYTHCCGCLRCQHPVMSPEGIVFDLLNIIPYLRKHHRVSSPSPHFLPCSWKDSVSLMFSHATPCVECFRTLSQMKNSSRSNLSR